MVALSKSGRRIGEDAPTARYADDEIDMVFMLKAEGYSIRQVAGMLDMPTSTVHAIWAGKLRAAMPDHWRKVKCPV